MMKRYFAHCKLFEFSRQKLDFLKKLQGFLENSLKIARLLLRQILREAPCKRQQNSIIEQSRSGKSLVCFSTPYGCFSALCARIFGTPCKVYIEAIELSSCWLYWVLLAEWMMLKAFSPKWEERNAKKNSFASFLCLLFCCYYAFYPN